MSSSIRKVVTLFALGCVGACDDADPAAPGQDTTSAAVDAAGIDAEVPPDTTSTTTPTEDASASSTSATLNTATLDIGNTFEEATGTVISPDPTDPATHLALDAGAADESLDAAVPTSAPSESASDAGGGGTDLWTPCGTGKCATIRVPVDYAEPNGETIGLRVFWGPAAEPQSRGFLFFNPGGPGVPMISDDSYLDWHYAMNVVAPEMDVVLMDNRGIGASEAVSCMSAAEANLRFGALDPDGGIEQLASFWRDWNDACVSSLGESRLANVHTRNVARDMDEVRKALGAEKIDAWVVSYGTVQGSFYAKLFPEHVRAFALDSVVFAGDNTFVDDLLDAIAAYDRELSRFLTWCADGDVCNLGTTPEEVNTHYDELRAQLAEGISVDEVMLDESSLAGTATGFLLYGRWDEFAEVVAAAADGDWTVLASTQGPLETGDDETDWRFTQANLVYSLMDYECPPDFNAEDALALYDAVNSSHPRIASSFGQSLFVCAGWYTPPKEPAVVPNDLESPPLLIMSGAHDPATPLEGAIALRNQFNNGSALYVAEQEGHGILLSDIPATLACGEFLAAGEAETFCDQLECVAPDETSVPLNALRVTKPVPGQMRLRPVPRLPIKFPIANWRR